MDRIRKTRGSRGRKESKKRKSGLWGRTAPWGLGRVAARRRSFLVISENNRTNVAIFDAGPAIGIYITFFYTEQIRRRR